MKTLTVLAALVFCATAYSQADQTVTLVVNGQGNTLDEAKQMAFRSAVEQAFGTFISSNTEILNDELVKDEIVSISNGNIQKFEVISETELPGGGYAITLRATVSVTQLTSFVESRGGEIEFKGALLSFNIKQQLLNEKNEEQAIAELVDVLKVLVDKSLSYDLSVGDAKAITGESDNWEIPLTITVRTNENFEMMYDYLEASLKGISMSESEMKSYRALNKAVYQVDLVSEPSLTAKDHKKLLSKFDGDSFDIMSRLKTVKSLSELKIKYGEDLSEHIKYGKTINGADDFFPSLYYASVLKENVSEKIYLRTLGAYRKILAEFTLHFCKSMLSVTIEDKQGKISISPESELRTCFFESDFLPILMNPRSDFFNIWKMFYRFCTHEYYGHIVEPDYTAVANKASQRFGGTRQELPWDMYGQIFLEEYADGAIISTITIRKTFTLDEINQLSGFKITAK